VLGENHGLSSGIDIVPYSINQLLNCVESKWKWAGLYHDNTYRSLYHS